VADNNSPTTIRLRAEGVEQVESALKRTSAAVDQVGTSTKQAAYAMRGLPAQFTDIVTSLQAGQAPLTVLLQQGGQIKDQFGSLGAAARGVAGYVSGMINPLTIAGAAVAGLAVAYAKGAGEADAFNRAIVASGNAGALTTGQLGAMASNIAKVTGSQHAAAAALAEFATSTRIGTENLQDFARAALIIERGLGQSVADTRKVLDDIAKSPGDTLKKLAEDYGLVNAAVYRQVRALEDVGKTAEAAALAQKTYLDEWQSRSERVQAGLGTLERAWAGLKKGASEAWSAMLGIGREKTLSDQIAEQNKRIADAQSALANPGQVSLGSASATNKWRENLQAQIASAEQILRGLQQRAVLEDNVTTAQRERNAQEKAELTWADRMRDLRSDAVKREQEHAKIRNEGLAAGRTELEIRKAIAAYDAQHPAKKSKTAKELEAQEHLLQKLSGLDPNFAEEWNRLTALWAAGRISLEELSKAQLELFNKQPAVAALAKAEDERAKALQRAAEESRKFAGEQDKGVASADKAVESAVKQYAAAYKLVGINEDLTAAQYDAAAAAAELKAQQESLSGGANDAVVEKFSQEAAKYRLAASIARGAAAKEVQNSVDEEQAKRDKALAEEAKKAQEEFQKAADNIDRALTDSFFRAAESGKSAFVSMRDAIKGLFNNMILKPIVQAAFAPLASSLAGVQQGVAGAFGGSVGGSFGGSAIGSAAGSFGSGLLGGGNSLLAGGLGNIGANFAFSGLGQSLGLSTAPVAEAMVAAELTTAGSVVAAIGTAIPWIAAAYALYSIFSGPGGAPKVGGSATANLQGLLPGATRLFTPSQADDKVGTTVQQLVSSVDKLAVTFGGSAAGLRLALGYDTDPGGKASARVASYVETALGRVPFLQSGRDVSNDALQTELATEGKRVMLAALQAADLQGGFAEIIGRLDPMTADPTAIDNLIALASALHDFEKSMQGLPGTLGEIAGLSATAVEQLANVSGGLDALKSNLSRYYSSFFSPVERQAAQTTQLRAALNDVGLGPDLSLPTAEIAAWYRTTVEGIDLQTEAGRNQYAAVLALAGPLADWIDATNALTPAAAAAASAVDTQRTALETSRDNLQGQITSMESTWGDLSHSISELENPARTVAQQILDLGSNIKTLEGDMARILGTGGLSLTEQLSAAVGVRGQIGSARVSLQDQVAQTITQGFIDRGDLRGAADYLKTLEDWLIAAIPTADNPGEFASRATSVLLQRMGIEAQITTGDAQHTLDLEKTARDLRIDQLDTELERLRTLKSVSEEIAGTLQDLRTGSLSALAPQTQATLARDSFDTILRAALGGDAKAASQLSGSANAYLTELQSFTASGGNYAGEFLRVTGALESFGASLTGVDGLITTAQDELKNLQGASNTPPTTDMSGQTLTGLTTIGNALDTASTNNENTITGLSNSITDLIDEWRASKTTLEGQFETVRQSWRDLVDDLDQVKRDLTTLAGNATFTAAQ